jgi:hypothetical protein
MERKPPNLAAAVSPGVRRRPLLFLDVDGPLKLVVVVYAQGAGLALHPAKKADRAGDGCDWHH